MPTALKNWKVELATQNTLKTLAYEVHLTSNNASLQTGNFDSLSRRSRFVPTTRFSVNATTTVLDQRVEMMVSKRHLFNHRHGYSNYDQVMLTVEQMVSVILISECRRIIKIEGPIGSALSNAQTKQKHPRRLCRTSDIWGTPMRRRFFRCSTAAAFKSDSPRSGRTGVK